MTTDTNALRALVARLRSLHDSRSPYHSGGVVGQACGLESYKIIATGNKLACMVEIADALPALLDETDAARRDAEIVRQMSDILAKASNRIAHRGDCNTRKFSYAFSGRGGCTCGADALEYEIDDAIRTLRDGLE